ncbi:MAG: hypothetical protein ACREF3_17610 [Acetobacteraceae bacterium]
MLRFGYLPSDFNPMVLMLGEAEDLHALAGVLREFARAPTETRLETLGFCAAVNDIRIALNTALPSGLHRLSGPGHVFAWNLDPAHARHCAELIDALTQADRPAGSEILEDGEIALKVSRGEYTDDFLRP